MVLGVPSKLSPDAINESLGVPKVSLEEDFKARLCNKSGVFMTVLMRSLSKADSAIKIWNNKQGTIYSSGAWDFKIIFTLLTKIITVYVKFFKISL